jgi:hypothetical protein
VNYEMGILDGDEDKWNRDSESWITLPDMQLMCEPRNLPVTKL